MRKFILIAILGLVWLASGCTASDREYVRNHIVLLEKHDASRAAPVTHHLVADHR